LRGSPFTTALNITFVTPTVATKRVMESAR
jgi:hypothetical protein